MADGLDPANSEFTEGWGTMVGEVPQGGTGFGQTSINNVWGNLEVGA